MKDFCGLYGRWGGEEFLLALPHKDNLTAEELAERIRSTVENYSVYDIKSKKSLEQEVTVTLGVNTVDAKRLSQGFIKNRHQESKKLISDEDVALSYGKLMGRNRVVRFRKFLYKEMIDLDVTRQFYFGFLNLNTSEVEHLFSSSTLFRKYSFIKEELIDHHRILSDYVSSRDTRTQSVFADKLYSQIRKLECPEKRKIIAFMKDFLYNRTHQ